MYERTRGLLAGKTVFGLALAACTGTGSVLDPPTPPTTPPFTTFDVLEVRGITATLHPVIGSIVVVDWIQNRPAEVHAEFSFDAGIWVSSPVASVPAGPGQALLLGIPYGTDTTWRLVAADGPTVFNSPDAVVRNADLPAAQLVGTLRVADPNAYDADGAPWLFTSLAGTNNFYEPWHNVVIDRLGRVVWALRSPQQRVSIHSRVARDGRSLYLDRNSYWAIFDVEASTIDQMRIDGSVIHTFDVPGLHHPFTDLPDGSVAWGATTGGYANEYLNVVHADGSVETVLDCMEWMRTIGQDGFCMSNTLSYDEGTDTLLLSEFSTETLVAVNRTTGAVDRWYGAAVGSWAFEPSESQFYWQHGGYVTEAGTLLTSSDRTARGDETIVREYAFDAVNHALVEIWNFGIGEGVYGGQMGEAVRLPNGNTLHNYGELARLREATPDKVVVWDIEWDSYAIGRSMPVADLYALAP